jgi:YhcN/YlaJ family sporulation lipoprotein
LRKIFTLLLCVGFLLISLMGCQTTSKKPMTPARKPGVTAKKPTTEMTASERRVMANKLSKMAENVQGVKRASVVVSSIGMTNTGVTSTTNKMTNTNAARTNYSGQIILVGLTLEPTATRDSATINKVKSTVATKLKASDRRISQVLVTTDPTMIKRINDVAAGIIEGKPIQNFQRDITDISGKIKKERVTF